MKKAALVFWLLIMCSSVRSQQLSQYSQYMLNQYSANPAALDVNQCVEGRMGQRLQWMGFEGAPRTSFFGINGFLPTRSSMLKGKHGIGLYVERDDLGFISKRLGKVSYSYHKAISRGLWMGVGVFAGLMQYGFNSPNLNLNVLPDNAVQQAASFLLYPDITPGVWLTSKKIYAGLAIQSIVGNSLTRAHGTENRLTRHIYGSAGYRIFLNDKKQSFTPSCYLKFTPMAPPSIDVNMLYDYRNKFNLGVGYRVGEAAIAMVKIQLIPMLWLGYSYDMPLNKIKYGSIQTHELMLGMKFCKGKAETNAPDICPAYQ
jgi:type IX secretion system PorP/SprF family membrane protein